MSYPSQRSLRGCRPQAVRPALEALRGPKETRDVEWDKVKDSVGALDAFMKEGDTWVMGNTPSFADFVMASSILTIRILYGEDSKEWKRIMGWHGGRWERLMVAVEKYSAVPNV